MAMKIKWKFVLLIAVLIGGVLSLFASSFPDGLEKVAEDQGFLSQEYVVASGLMPAYQVSWVSNVTLASLLAGIIGTFSVFGVLFGIGSLLFSSEVSRKKEV